ncbi:meiotic nuclear division protein 1 homolog isoform X3 [Podarcis muralis]|uniref:meiotic nuclear division protein 1 homolog isoform X2 n=1 Tax=Podarcis raffonei TaxID=65483 RepID=UPI002329422F|nr:meiotic nuclear division protein 1 homolog isoform X2 [Podarcis raffonei]XP_053259055.1 meiotic nuclear division protein 1 homolog isoform X2 [Podarcis raffonei]
MSKKRGLSVEEKRTRMMEIFFETKDVFQLKDIEKIAPKEKGITAMSVKEVLQSLVDDSMVDTDRIGTSNYFWAFPSKALHARKRKLEELQNQFSEYSQKKKSLQESIEKSKIGRQDTVKQIKWLRKQPTDGLIISLQQNLGPNGSLHLKRAKLTKHLAFLKTLTTSIRKV